MVNFLDTTIQPYKFFDTGLFQDVPGGWGQQVDPSQWSAYYGYGQGYDAYTYGATQDPSLYAYNSYGGYANYPQQVNCFDVSNTCWH